MLQVRERHSLLKHKRCDLKESFKNDNISFLHHFFRLKHFFNLQIYLKKSHIFKLHFLWGQSAHCTFFQYLWQLSFSS